MQYHLKTIFKKLQQRLIKLLSKNIIKIQHLDSRACQLEDVSDVCLVRRLINKCSGRTNSITLSSWDNVKLQLVKCADPTQVVKEAIHTQFQKKLLAKSPEELSNDESIINVFQTNASKQIILDSEVDTYVFISFRAAINTYNSALLFNMVYNPEVVEKIYFQTITMISNSYR